MRRTLFTWFLLLGAALAISACCANNSCDCRDSTDDAVYLRFSLDSLGGTGFYSKEVRNVYIRRQPVRMADEKAALPAPDSVRLTRTLAQLRDSIVLSPTTPFTNQGRRFDAYQYIIRMPEKIGAKPLRKLLISDVSVQGSFNQSDGCCTCYTNTRKQLTIDGKKYDFSGQPAQTVVLTR